MAQGDIQGSESLIPVVSNILHVRVRYHEWTTEMVQRVGEPPYDTNKAI